MKWVTIKWVYTRHDDELFCTLTTRMAHIIRYVRIGWAAADCVDESFTATKKKQPTCVDCWAFSVMKIVYSYMSYSLKWGITQQLSFSLSSSLARRVSHSPPAPYILSPQTLFIFEQHTLLLHSFSPWQFASQHSTMPRSLFASREKYTTKASIIWLCK